MRKWGRALASALATEIFLHLAMGGVAVLPVGLTTLWVFLTDQSFTPALWALIGMMTVCGVLAGLTPYLINKRHQRTMWRLLQHEKATELFLEAVDDKDETKISVVRHTWRRWLRRGDYTDS